MGLVTCYLVHSGYFSDWRVTLKSELTLRISGNALRFPSTQVCIFPATEETRRRDVTLSKFENNSIKDIQLVGYTTGNVAEAFRS